MSSPDIILVVDDSSNTLSFINDTLESAGFNVLVALEGKQALTIAKRIRPDMVLLDALMPIMDGFETCAQLKADPELASIPVIFMTGLTETDSIVKALEVGGVDYLRKPINPDELLARMRVHLSNSKLTISAQNALDSTGQLLFSVNQQGKIVWATPQTHALFAKAKLSQQWRENEMSMQLRRWLLHNPTENNSLKLLDIEWPIEVVFIEHRADDEILLKLRDGKKIPGEKILREQLNLTQRESQVLFWLCSGKTNREIAEILGMSPRTVNKHLELVFPKLGVENRTAAASIAIRILS